MPVGSSSTLSWFPWRRASSADERRELDPADATLLEIVRLRTGNVLELRIPRSSVCDHHLLMVFPESQGEISQDELFESAAKATQYASQIARSTHGDPEAYVVVKHGSSVARVRAHHWHLLLVKTREEKASAYQQLAARNL